MTIFAQIFGYLLGLIYSVVQDYGIAIVIFTLITKFMLLPFTLKQMKSTKEMAMLQPKMKEIQDKYKDNKEKQNQMMMELYKEHNYNPLSGCLPLLIQFPIIIGLFTAMREPGNYVFHDPELLARATQDAFLWMKDLSQPDLVSNIITTGPDWLLTLPGLMPLISAIFTYFQMSSMNASQSGVNAQANSTMKMMQIFFPAMILLWGKTFSAGLILYWTVGAIFQVAQQYLLNRPVKGDKA